MQRQITTGTTDVSVTVRIVDSSDGTPETGVTSATSGLNFWYRREGGLVVNLTESDLSAADDAHSDGGLIHLSDGYYRIDVNDAAFGSGAAGVLVGGTATGMVVIGAYIQLIAVNLNDAVRAGLTALPNAAADAAGGLPISDAGGLDLDAILVDTNALNDTKIPDTISLAAINAEADTALVDYDPPTNAEMVARTLASAAYFDAATDTVTVGTNNDKSGYSISGTKTTLDALQDLSAAQVNTEADTALADIHLDHLLAVNYDPASKPGVATALLNELVEDDVGVSRFTANALEQAPSGTGASAATIADAVWDEAIAGHVAAGSFGEEVQAHALSSEVSALNNFDPVTDTVTLSAATEAQIDAIEADTNELQGDWTNGGRLDLLIDAILGDTGTDIPALIAALNDLDAATVNAQVVDALGTDTYAEPAAVPAATATLAAKIGWLYLLARNKVTQTGTTQTVFADDTSTSVAASTVSDDSTTATRGEWT